MPTSIREPDQIARLFDTAFERFGRLGQQKRLSSACYSMSQMCDDGILDPVDTRNALRVAISATLNAPPALRRVQDVIDGT